MPFSISSTSLRAALVCVTALWAFSTNAFAQAVGQVNQDRKPTLQASQAATPVPPVAYRSVFQDLPKGVESTVLDWKTSNANVGQFKRGHADVLKWDQEQAAKQATTKGGKP